MAHLEPVTLTGSLVQLEPLRAEHHDELVAAAKDGSLWELWYTSVPTPDGMAEAITQRLNRQAAGEMLPFVTRRRSDSKLIGMTSFAHIDLSVPIVEIGYTWNAASAQGSGTNPDSKLLLLTHAFEVMGCECVQLQTAWNNQQSRAAIARLGAKQDGVLRSNRRFDNGLLRDTVVFSILASEWPTVKAGLELRLARYRQG